MSVNSPRRLFYFRHGETAWSLSGRHTEVTDIPLTPQGEAQARSLAPWTATISFAHVFTSPRLRARATGVAPLWWTGLGLGKVRRLLVSPFVFDGREIAQG